MGLNTSDLNYETIEFDLQMGTELPQNLIDDAPSSGRFDDFAEYITDNYNVKLDIESARKVLKEYGIDEVEAKDDLEVTHYILWISILDCKQNSETFWVCS